jgi:cyclophilin family peptidyl-prolyl cis-trans isomerase
MKRTLILFASLAIVGAGCAGNLPAPEPAPVAVPSPAPSQSSPSTPVQPTLAFPGIQPAAEVDKKILIKTTKGDIVIQLDSKLGPRAASNFVYLVKNHFYDGTIFHRVIPGFMIQGGDPTGSGRGGPGYRFENDPVNVPYKDGVVAMANAGRDTNGSQFFIMVADYPLPPDYSVFGKVVSGLDVAHAIADVDRDGGDRPIEEVKMVSVTIQE